MSSDESWSAQPGSFRIDSTMPRVDAGKRSLNELERQRRNLLVPDPVGRDLATLAEEHEAVRAVPVPDLVQALVDLAAEALEPDMAAEEDRLDGEHRLSLARDRRCSRHTVSCDAATTQTCHHGPNSETAPHFAALPKE